jgi:hypothetical protein
LLTDTTNKGWLDKQTIDVMNSHGKIKHLLGLHAKLYIIDDHALVTSANLTDTAFARRHEVGVFLSTNREYNLVSGKPEAFHALAFGGLPCGLSFDLPVARGRFCSHTTGGCSSDFCTRGAGHL